MAKKLIPLAMIMLALAVAGYIVTAFVVLR